MIWSNAIDSQYAQNMLHKLAISHVAMPYKFDISFLLFA